MDIDIHQFRIPGRPLNRPEKDIGSGIEAAPAIRFFRREVRRSFRGGLIGGTGWLLVFCGLTAGADTELTGTVDSIRPGTGGLELAVVAGTNHLTVVIANAGGNCPELNSRIRVTAGVVSTNSTGGAQLTVAGLDQIQLLTGQRRPLAGNVAELRRLGAGGQHAACVAHLEGLVLGASPGGRALAFQDGTGVALLELKVPGPVALAGQKMILEGNCLVEGERVLLGSLPVVDNNNIHSMSEKTGAIFLSAGRHSVRLDWFNHEFPYGLEVYYQGPELARQKIPDTALFHREANPSGGEPRWAAGLEYRGYEGGFWLRVPDFDGLLPAAQGVATNFDLSVIPRVNDVGMRFTGYVEVPQDGIYGFSTISDDGSLLFVDEQPPVLAVTGSQRLPEPEPVELRQYLRGEQDDRWSQAEGKVTFAGRRAGGLELELSSDTGRMRVEVADGTGGSPLLLLNSRVRVTGICLAARVADGPDVAGKMLVPGMNQIEWREAPPEYWTGHPLIPVAGLAGLAAPPAGESTVQVRGIVRPAADGSYFLEDGTGTVKVEMPSGPGLAEGRPVEMAGCWRETGQGRVLHGAFWREISGPGHDDTAARPVLVTVEQIKRLTREEWQRGYPVKIRGVVTTVLDNGFFIQDATRSIYARWWPPTDSAAPRVGDFWEVEGTTFAEFAPNILVNRAERLGPGTLPEPLRPTWDQLINGSLDTEYVEVQGIITAAVANEATLLTGAGKIILQLPDVQPGETKNYVNARVRVRGCVMPVRDVLDRQFVPGQMRLCQAAITVEEPAPADPFGSRLKHAADLLAFDVQAGALERVKIAGQIVHAGNGQFYLMDGSDGVRVIPKAMGGVQTGDLVEAVGFPDLGGPSPTLREAVLRPISNARLPDPVFLPPGAPLNRKYDATLVRLQARLDGVNADQTEQVLELEAGTRALVARLKKDQGMLPGIQPGSLLELTGVYAGHGSGVGAGREIDSFELLLNSAADVRVLARPPWWNVRRMLTALGGLGLVMAGGLVWIGLLRRQVAERTNQLATEIRRHERTERRRELEEERTRIARDLHDDLGATLTQIRFLSALESRDAQLPESTRHRMGQVTEKSREMVASLDEIVWAVNPANDSLPNLANYLCHFAEEFFRPTAIRCRLDVADMLPAAPLTSEVRHHLYLAVREALNNIAKHSQATEVWLRIRSQPPGVLCVQIEDNGRGFEPAAGAGAGEGLANMRGRLEKIGGRFEFETRPGAGVVCRLILPVEEKRPGQREA